MKVLPIDEINLLRKKRRLVQLDKVSYVVTNMGEILGSIVSLKYLEEYLIKTDNSQKISINEFIKNIDRYISENIVILTYHTREIIVYLSAKQINPQLFVKVICPTCGSEMEETLSEAAPLVTGLDLSPNYVCLECLYNDVKNNN